MAADTKVTASSIIKKIAKQTDIALALGVMFILVIIFNSFVISKYKIIDLFSSAYSTHDLSSAFVNAAPVGLLGEQI